MANNPLLLFLQEIFTRFATKSPKFFRIWQIILGALVAITGLPELLEYYNIEVPEAWQALMNETLGKISTGALIMSMLVTQSKTVAVTKDGDALKQTNPNYLPFTAHIEKKKALDKPVIAVEVVKKVDVQEEPKTDSEDKTKL